MHVGQDGAPRPYPCDPVQRTLQMSMARMWPMAQGVDDPAFHIFKDHEALVIQCVDIGTIGQRSDAKPQATDTPMPDTEGLYRHRAARARDGEGREWFGQHMASQDGWVTAARRC